MAFRSGLTRQGSCVAFLVCFLFVLQNVSSTSAAPPSVFNSETLKAVKLLPPSTGTSGLSRLIKPISQSNVVNVYYPGASAAEPEDRVSYNAWTLIQFVCLEPTKRIAVHVNPLWSFYWVSVFAEHNGTSRKLAVDELLIDVHDETLYIDLAVDMEPHVAHTLNLGPSGPFTIDEDDRYGIQAFNQTDEGSGGDVIRIELSSVPKVMRRFIPCFDDSEHDIPQEWYWTIKYGGFYAPAVVVMNKNAVVTYSNHFCPPDDPADHHCIYGFSMMEQMAIEGTQLGVVPYSWIYPGEEPKCRKTFGMQLT